MFEYEYNSRTFEISYSYDMPDPSVGYSGGVTIDAVYYKGQEITLPYKVLCNIENEIYEMEQNRKYEEKAMRAEWLHDKDR